MSLIECNNLANFNKFFEDYPPKVKIGPLGGRHFYLAGKKYSLNAILAKLESLRPKGLPQGSAEQITSAYQLLLSLHKEGDRRLAKASLFQRRLTALCHFSTFDQSRTLEKYERRFQIKELNELKTHEIFIYETEENPIDIILEADYKNIQKRQIILNNFKRAKKILKNAKIPFGKRAKHWPQLKSAFLSTDKEQLKALLISLKADFSRNRLMVTHVRGHAV